jgi:hypothetical protein
MTFDVGTNTQNVHDRDGRALGDDLLWGVKAIASEINRTERQTFNLVKTAAIPVRKIGGRYVASRTALRRHFA